MQQFQTLNCRINLPLTASIVAAHHSHVLIVSRSNCYSASLHCVCHEHCGESLPSVYSAQTRSILLERKPGHDSRSEVLAMARALLLTSMPANRTPAGESLCNSAFKRMDVLAALPHPSSTTTQPGTPQSRHILSEALLHVLRLTHRSVEAYWEDLPSLP